MVSKKDLWETYLPAFEACVKEARVEGVMGAYNRIPLNAGEKKIVSFTLDQKVFKVVDQEGNISMDSRRFRIYAGGSQPDSRSIELLGRSPLQAEIDLGV